MVLPTPTLPLHSVAKLHGRSPPRSRFLLFGPILVLLYWIHTQTTWRLAAPIPPDYRAWHERELSLPQNNAQLPHPQGKYGKYIRFATHATGIGWEHHMQAMILNAQLALRTGRIFVFYNYTSDADEEQSYFPCQGRNNPAQIPITAFVEGPIAGGPFFTHREAQPAISSEFFDEVCPEPIRASFDPSAAELAPASDETMLNHYADELRTISAQCVEFDSGFHRPDFGYTFGDPAGLHGIWDELVQSPILTDWVWSPLVVSIAEQNHARIHPALSSTDTQRAALPRLLALHVPFGNTPDDCDFLRDHQAPFRGFNSRPEFPDRLWPAPEPGLPPTEAHPGRTDYSDVHCSPSLELVVDKVLSVRAEYPTLLDRIYILADKADPSWLASLTAALRARAEWASIGTTHDLVLTDEQAFVVQAVDMMVASRADVFIGDGFSDLASMVNLLRVAHGHSPSTSRFW